MLRQNTDILWYFLQRKVLLKFNNLSYIVIQTITACPAFSRCVKDYARLTSNDAQIKLAHCFENWNINFLNMT